MPAVGAAVTMGPAQVGSMGVGLAEADDVETGVGDGGGPGQIEMLCREGPAGEGTPHGVIGTPPAVVGHGVDPPPPPPQLHEKATANSIIAAPSRIHRALSIIGIQL